MADRRAYRRARRRAGLETYASLGAEQKAKAAARGAVSWALWHGKLKRQPCEVCGATPAQAHHADYSKPLDVQWLCPDHHREADAVKRRREEEAMHQSKPSPLVQRYRDEVIAERDVEPAGIERVGENLIERYREVEAQRLATDPLAADMRSEMEQALDAVLEPDEADRPAPPIIDRSKLRAVIALNAEIAELQADIAEQLAAGRR